MRDLALFSITSTLTVFLLASSAAAEAEPARAADAFVDFVGVNTHLAPKLPWTSPGIRLFRPNASAEPTERIAAANQRYENDG